MTKPWTRPPKTKVGQVRIADWRGVDIEVARSVNGVLATASPWDNVIRTGIHPWPPPELIQKLYKSNHGKAFVDASVTAHHGFYSDLQSIHSEDAITWSVFGPVIYADSSTRSAFVHELLRLLGIPHSDGSTYLWLWRRLPHPDTLVPGGPEVDFGIQTDGVFLLGEAKWRSAVGANQGVLRDKDQFTLRREFCAKYGKPMLPTCTHFVILAVSWIGGVLPSGDTSVEGVAFHERDVTWGQLTSLSSHPCRAELKNYVDWKARNSQPLA